MCAVAGIVAFDAPSVPLSWVKGMTQAQAHRGPDSWGHQLLPGAALGHRRLAILDLSSAGHQPMSYNQERYWITFNGEIYNYPILRKQLEQQGHRFRSHCDTECILAAYQEYGTNCIQHLDGMFAFAIYDTKTRALFAARDRLGKKPFKYIYTKTHFAFASELKALLTLPFASKEPDTEALKSYLYWGHVPSPATGFLDIWKLPAAHCLLLQNGKLQTWRYWDVQYQPNLDRSEEETRTALREAVTQAVSSRLMSDVPLGAFLSGGVDSAVVTGLMAQLQDTPPRTFTVGFPGWKYDEADIAQTTADFQGTQHTTLTVPEFDIATVLHDAVIAYEEPFGDSSAIPSLLVSQETRKHVTVALNGDGGDENFLGYSTYQLYQSLQPLHTFRHLFAIADSALQPLKRELLRSPSGQRLLRTTAILQHPAIDAYALYARGYLNGMVWNDLVPTGLPLPAEFQAHHHARSQKSVNDIAIEDLKTILPDGLMSKIDIATMHFGLEGRSPLLDHRVVELAATIPQSQKLSGGHTKKIFRETFSDLIPPSVLSLPKKGFVPPINAWLAGPLQPELNALHTTDTQLFSVLDRKSYQLLTELHQDSVVDAGFLLWRVLQLQLWFSHYF